MNLLTRLSPLALVMPLLIACTSHVETGGGGGSGGASCPAPSPGLCPPSVECIDGHEQTGQALCEDGQWVCAQVTCDIDAGCTGSLGTTCVGGQIASFCCPADVPCAVPVFCDLGNGTCVDGEPCPVYPDAGTQPCSAGPIEATDYDQACAVDSDCTPVYSGPLCDVCFCPTAAIAQSALASYQSAIAASGAVSLPCNCPDFPNPVCAMGVCVLP